MRQSKFFGSPAFRRLWFSQLFSSLGDWIGLIAITAIASRVGGSLAYAGVALVIGARIAPGVIFSPLAGVLADRWDRKTIMVVTDVGRGIVLCFLPFVNHLWGLILVSLLLEMGTMMFSAAKEASVPNLVRRDFLPTANSMSLAAGYGTFVPAAALFAVLAKVPEWLGQSDTLRRLNLTPESVALYFDALTYLLSAIVIATLTIPKLKSQKPIDTEAKGPSSWEQAKNGMTFVWHEPRVRGVVFGMGLGLFGGATVVPLGSVFSTDVLGAGSGGYGLLLTAMGGGVTIGVLLVTVFQKRLPLDRVFITSAFFGALFMIIAASMHSLAIASAIICLFGVCVGALYVTAMTLLQTSVDDEMRGRVFATFYTVTRLSTLGALIAAPLFSIFSGQISKALFGSDGVDLFGATFALSGVRITLWAGGLIILMAVFLAASSFRRQESVVTSADS